MKIILVFNFLFDEIFKYYMPRIHFLYFTANRHCEQILFSLYLFNFLEANYYTILHWFCHTLI